MELIKADGRACKTDGLAYCRNIKCQVSAGIGVVVFVVVIVVHSAYVCKLLI